MGLAMMPTMTAAMQAVPPCRDRPHQHGDEHHPPGRRLDRHRDPDGAAGHGDREQSDRNHRQPRGRLGRRPLCPPAPAAARARRGRCPAGPRLRLDVRVGAGAHRGRLHPRRGDGRLGVPPATARAGRRGRTRSLCWNKPPLPQVAYTRGLHELGDGLYAYLQPDGGWGWSNAGLVTAGGASLLVDTLYDLKLTRAMLEAMAPVTERAPDRRRAQHPRQPRPLLRQRAAARGHRDLRLGGRAEEMRTRLAGGAARAEVRARHATRSRRLRRARLRPVRLRQHQLPRAVADVRRAGLDAARRRSRRAPPGAGPGAHRRRHHRPRPRQRARSSPATSCSSTAPPSCGRAVGNWIAACDRILELGATTLVPGHGPVTDASGVRDVRRYLQLHRRPGRAALRRGHGRRRRRPTTSTSRSSPTGATPSGSPPT